MNNEQITIADTTPIAWEDVPALVQKISKTTYKVRYVIRPYAYQMMEIYIHVLDGKIMLLEMQVKHHWIIYGTIQFRPICTMLQDEIDQYIIGGQQGADSHYENIKNSKRYKMFTIRYSL